MPFWTQEVGTADTDPKRKFRFVVTFDGIDAGNGAGGGVAWYAKTAGKPSFTINAAEHKYLNHTFYYPGNVTWNEVTIALVDPVNPDMASTLSDIVQAGGYVLPTIDKVGAPLTINKGYAVEALGRVTIEQQDAYGIPKETWTLHNAWIKDVKFGDLEYGSDDLTQIDVILKYDWASMESPGDSAAKTKFSSDDEYFTVGSPT